MPRVGFLLLVLVVAAGAAVGAVPRPPAEAFVRMAVEFAPADDPFPIRRVRGSDASRNGLLKELEPGPTVRLPRAEFESRVRAAGRAQAKQPARVIEANYTATLDAGDLTGTAELVLLNTHDATGFVPLDPLRLAVRGAKWTDGPDAVLATRSGVPAVWVDRDGRRTLQLNWSLAGTTEHGERRFELRVPPCPMSSLELNLPADQVPASSSDVLLTGPFDVAGAPARRSWRLRFGGRTKVEFAVRAAGAPVGIAQAKLAAKYDLTPGQLTATFEYDLRPARGSAGEWSFTADPGLRVVDVATNNQAAWAVDPPASPNGPRRVRVSLRQPGPGGKVIVTAIAPFPDPARPDSPLPSVRPLNTVLDDEQLEVRVAPALKLDGWAPGDYRLLDANTSVLSVADQARTFALAGTLLAPGADEPFRRMPTVRTAPAEADFTVLERLEWELDAARSALVARIAVRVRRGPLFQITVRPPVGFVLDRAASGSDDLVSHVGAASTTGHVLEFTRPLAAGQRAELRLEFRGPGARPGEPVAFPTLAVAGATERDGWLSATAGPEWELVAKPGAGATPGGLWGWFTTDPPANARALYLYRGREPDGIATLTATRATVDVDSRTTIDAPGAEWVATTRFALNVTRGALPAATVFVPGPRDARSWILVDESNAIVATVPVPGEFVGAPGRTVWVLRFARPLVGAAVIETAAPVRVPDDPVVYAPRLLGSPQAARVELAPAARDRAILVPMLGDRLTLMLSHQNAALPVSDAYLVTAVRGLDDALAAFGGTVRDTRGGTVGVFLPDGAEIRGVCVAGQWLNPAVCAARDNNGALPVPISAGSGVRFEVRYRVPVENCWPTRRITNRVPNTTHGSVLPIKQWWVFVPGVLPASFGKWAVAGEKLPLLGGPLTGEAGALVVRVPDDGSTFRVGATRNADVFAVGSSTMLLMIGLVAARRRRARGAIVLGIVVLVTFTLTNFGPPWWARVARPPFCAAIGALALVLANVVIHARLARAVATASLIFAVFTLTAAAQPPDPATVLLLTDAEGREEIVAARATMDRIDALAKPQPPAAVVATAEYDVRADETGARVVAKFVVHAFRASDNAVSLPLDGARLERATVDGVPALPNAARPDVYSLSLGGPGRHEIELRFAATVTATGPDRDLRFGVPEVPAAKLAAILPGAARQPAVVGRVGRQSVTTGDRTTVEADLGSARSAHLRWREGAGGAAVVKVRECCVWDATESGADLTAAYVVRVEQGAVAGLRFEVPAELEVLRVAARTADAPVGPIALRDWTLTDAKGGFRLLRLDFQAPIAGRFVVVLECAPRKPITRQPALRFPRVAFGTVTGETETVYGLRATRVAIDSVGLGGVIDFPPDTLKDFAAIPDLKLDPNAAVRAFRPAPGATGELRPVLRVNELPAARTVTAWHVGPQRADASGVVSWIANDSLPLVEFTIPGVRVLEVRGPDVVAWGQGNGRVQVWLRAGAKEGVVEWTGTVTVPAPAKPTDPIAFDPVWPRVHGTRVSGDEVRVRPVAGWDARPVRVRGWEPVHDRTGDLRFRTDLPSAPALRMQLAPIPTAGR